MKLLIIAPEQIPVPPPAGGSVELHIPNHEEYIQETPNHNR